MCHSLLADTERDDGAHALGSKWPRATRRGCSRCPDGRGLGELRALLMEKGTGLAVTAAAKGNISVKSFVVPDDNRLVIVAEWASEADLVSYFKMREDTGFTAKIAALTVAEQPVLVMAGPTRWAGAAVELPAAPPRPTRTLFKPGSVVAPRPTPPPAAAAPVPQPPPPPPPAP